MNDQPNRAERRRRARQKISISMEDDRHGTMVVGTGQFVDVDHHPERNLPDKVEGEHRWIVAVAYTIADPWKVGVKHMDQENLISVSTGCYDCEQPWRADVDRHCPGDPNP